MYRSQCPLASALDLVGDKWSMLIIRDIFWGKTTFKQFLESKEKIASNILSARLKWLQEIGIISYVHKDNNKKVKHYYLSNKGVGLYRVQLQLVFWSDTNYDREFITLTPGFLNKNRNRPIEELAMEGIANYLERRQRLLIP